MTEHSPESIAIVGMAAAFPKAPDLHTYWDNIGHAVDAIGDVPPERIDPSYFDADVWGTQTLPCRRGGFLDDSLRFDALDFGIMPVAARTAEPDQLLALKLACDALGDAGIPIAQVAGTRAGVFLGRGGYMGAGIVRLDQRLRTGGQLLALLASRYPQLPQVELAEVRRLFEEALGASSSDDCIGLVPNLAASRIANRFDLRGPAYTVDAACASALVAVQQACEALHTGRCDLGLAGGVHLCHDVTLWHVFHQLGAMSRSQQIRPFSKNADGLLIGEGAGLVVLKRLADAERAGDRIYSVIRGVGSSSDGRSTSLMSPSVEGQAAAMSAAWRQAALSPATLGLLEAHGTGTSVGDETELQSIASAFADDRPRDAVLGSVKSMIGHTMPAAGIAGLIKASMSVYHGILPATLHCEDPHPALRQAGLRVLSAAQPWETERKNDSRRAAVSAFGFGGINAHVVIESHSSAMGRPDCPPLSPPPSLVGRKVPNVLFLRAESAEFLERAIETGTSRSQGSWRLAVMEPSTQRLALAARIVRRGHRWQGRKGIWFSRDGLAEQGGAIALLYPGIESRFLPSHDDALQWLGEPPLTYRAAKTSDQPAALQEQGSAVIQLGRSMTKALGRLGVKADMIGGHSIGEWTGMIASGLVAEADVDQLMASLPTGSLRVPNVAFAALGCGADRLRDELNGHCDVVVSHDNCAHQCIICGGEEAITRVLATLRSRGVVGHRLPFRSGFHAPVFAPYLEPYRQHLSALPLGDAHIPLWSATTASPYPTDAASIRALVLEHLTSPVRFRAMIRAMYSAGARVFLQMGVGSLTAFVDDILRDSPHVTVSAVAEKTDGISQLARVVAALYVEGYALDGSALGFDLGTPTSLGGRALCEEHVPSPATVAAKPARTGMPLALATPLIKVAPWGAELPIFDRHEQDGFGSPHRPGDAMMQAFSEVSRGVKAASVEVLHAWQRAQTEEKAPPPPCPEATGQGARGAATPLLQRTPVGVKRRFMQRLSLGEAPYLRDHTFYRQPADWPDLESLYPVVPMTMLIDLMMRSAMHLVPGHVVVAVEGVQAFRWLAVAPPVEVAITAEVVGSDPQAVRVVVRIDGWAKGAVLLAPAHGTEAAFQISPLRDGKPLPLRAVSLYDDRWMFHGPAYQGVREIGLTSPEGIDGELAPLTAPGALLDNAGQLMGLWIMYHCDVDRLAFPMQIKRIRFYSEQPRGSEWVSCRVRITDMDGTVVRADMELEQAGRPWARVEGWVDRRFNTDPQLWDVLRFPEKNGLAVSLGSGAYCLRQPWNNQASRELIARRYLNVAELRLWEALPSPRRDVWLMAQIAAKDAIRAQCWKDGQGALFPIEVHIDGAVEATRVQVPAAAAQSPDDPGNETQGRGDGAEAMIRPAAAVLHGRGKCGLRVGVHARKGFAAAYVARAEMGRPNADTSETMLDPLCVLCAGRSPVDSASAEAALDDGPRIALAKEVWTLNAGLAADGAQIIDGSAEALLVGPVKTQDDEADGEGAQPHWIRTALLEDAVVAWKLMRGGTYDAGDHE